ncbi:class II glutamine amidotransferase [Acidocella aquatica]|uniref:Class II glutamine amidotransferase n=1 Tax=Acidocella aquatica TaxID=1922313 RepID=A0ABQ6A2D1_9PROT|nr:class II glutamine amidotransferase [Acidocella aquatica]GLR65936.1 class II glutamine amidotransferase [Acidocella aquatica]
MCELFALSSKISTNVNFSLNIFARHGSVGGRTVDGWGLAFYDGRDVRLYKEPEPAGQSDWLSFIEQRKQLSSLVLSHIRRATQGGISLSNTQPFMRELGGQAHVFAHNGNLAGIGQRMAGRWKRFQPIGQTDSEIAFCILLEALSPLWAGGAVPSVAARRSVIQGLAAEFRELGPANFIYADGDALFAHGHRRIQQDGMITPPGLFWLVRTCGASDELAPASGVRIGIGDTPQALMLFASVPLTDEAWNPLQEGELIAVREGLRIYDPDMP